MLITRVYGLLLSLMLLFGFSLPVLAADNSITINPVLFPFELYHVDYEFSVSEKSTYNLMLIYYADDNFFDSLAEGLTGILGGDSDSYSYTYGCKIGKRWYEKKAQDGLYYGIEGTYTQLIMEDSDSSEYSAGACFGKRRITDSGYTYDLGFNIAYYKDSDDDTGISFFITTHIGYGW